MPKRPNVILIVDEVTLGDAYKHVGYATGLIGKWHNGAFDDRYHPNARGFDEFLGFPRQVDGLFRLVGRAQWKARDRGRATHGDGKLKIMAQQN